MSCRVAIEHQEDEAGVCEPADLGLRKGCSKESDGIGEPGLSDAHDGPGALNQDDALVLETTGTVSVVKNVSLGEVPGETPFAEL